MGKKAGQERVPLQSDKRGLRLINFKGALLGEAKNRDCQAVRLSELLATFTRGVSGYETQCETIGNCEVGYGS
jgi:hypothetical protein